MATTTVEVKSAWSSKINWGQAVGMVATVLVLATGGKVNMDMATQGELVAVIQGLTALYTWAMRTFFTTAITPSSAAKIS